MRTELEERERILAIIAAERRTMNPGQGMTAARRRAVIAWADAKLDRIVRKIEEVQA